MKYLNALLLMFALSVNAHAGIGLCSMQHEVISEQAQKAMPCHNDEHLSDEAKPHLCDCDMCVQLTCSTNIIKSNALFNETPRFIGTPYQSLPTSPTHRPPINFLS